MLIKIIINHDRLLRIIFIEAGQFVELSVCMLHVIKDKCFDLVEINIAQKFLSLN